MSRYRRTLDALPVRLAAVAAALALGAPARADADAWPAVVTRQAHLRAGPGPSYPVIAVLIPGTPVEVRGCLPSYIWCDVELDVRRGWVHAVNLEAYSGGDHVRLPDAAALLGIAIIGFALREYWEDHYRARPWYGQRERWARPPPAPPRALPSPPSSHPPHSPPRGGPAPKPAPGAEPRPGPRPGQPPGSPPRPPGHP